MVRAGGGGRGEQPPRLLEGQATMGEERGKV